MADTPRHDLCPCGSGKEYRQCHGATHIAPATPGGRPIENPFRRIFREDGTLDQEYVTSRLRHLEEMLRERERFLPLRYDRDEMERILREQQHLFRNAGSQAEFEVAYRQFAAVVLPELVTREFDEKAKEILQTAVQDPGLTPRDRAAAACGIVLTLPPEGESAPPYHENAWFDLVLRITYNESIRRAEFFAKLEEEDLSELEREARIQDLLRELPALAYELAEGFRSLMRRALSAYERGEYSFGLGADMVLHGIRTIRRLTSEFREDEGETYTDRQREEFQERFGREIRDAFAEDIAEEEEVEVLTRMRAFLEQAREAGKRKTVKGLESALILMEHNSEVRTRLLLAAYHEALGGRRLFLVDDEEPLLLEVYRSPFDLESYVEYGAFLESRDMPIRAERVYRSAMEFFPEDEHVRERLAAIAEALRPAREAEFEAEMRRRLAMEEE